MIPRVLYIPFQAMSSIPGALIDTYGIKLGRPAFSLSSELIRAARALLRWEQRDLANASAVSLPTIKRLESRPGVLAAHGSTLAALRKAIESAGVEFIDENGGGLGVRLRKGHRKEG
jgi:hypothetical protein